MTDLERLLELVETGIDTGRFRLTTHERDIFDGIRRRYREWRPIPVLPMSTEMIEDNRNPALEEHINRAFWEAIGL
ncbi:hypothetical protein [Rhodococcus sp. 11-3]|uniref:hypothetical protein n=1 Tax=Rhodococcus sp. 11-3 TaxID=2854796 RepID=UPI00203BC321|nr:hypothetical protein [Rhodococcus sp. 11-3]USC17007.1 hypothetical protein KZJ41_09135 [Rhodococcus sp. 11-3]